MALEIEAKFLDIDHVVMRQKLESIGAVLEHPMRLMKRSMYDFPDRRLQKRDWGRLRIRDEGNKSTFSYKSGGEGHYAEELETVISSYDETLKIVETIGLQKISFQESKRETWRHENVEIVLDEWPWIPTFIEIEGPDENAIRSTAQQLDLEWRNAVFGNVDSVYRRCYSKMRDDESIMVISELQFNATLPDWLKDRQ